AGLALLPEGDVRLTDNLVTLAQNTTAHTAYFSDLNRVAPFDVACIEWGGTEPTTLELQRLKLWLNPRVNGSLSRDVVQWKVELVHVSRIEALLDPNGTTRTMLSTMSLCDP